MAEVEKIFFNGRFVDPWTEVPEGKLRDKAVEKFVRQHGIKKSMVQEYNVQKLNPKFNAKLSKLKNIVNWAQTGPSPLNRIMPRILGKAASRALMVPAAISDVLLGTKLTPGRSDWELPNAFKDFFKKDSSIKSSSPQIPFIKSPNWATYNDLNNVKTIEQDKEQPVKPVIEPVPKVTAPKATKPQAPPGRPVSGPHKTYQDTAQDKQEQRQQQQSASQQTVKKGVGASGPPGRNYPTKKSRRHYAKGGGVRTSKYVL